MVASGAEDENVVQYYFENVSIAGHCSTWQNNRDWTDTGLTASTEYCYRVKTRDISPNANETAWSNTACASTPMSGSR